MIRVIFTKNMDAAIIAQRERGMGWVEIADHVGVCLQTTKERARHLGLSMKRVNWGQYSGLDTFARGLHSRVGPVFAARAKEVGVAPASGLNMTESRK